MDEKKIAALEAAVFASKGITLKKLCRIFKTSEEEMKEAIRKLSNKYSSEEHGIELKEVDGRYRFYTKPKYSSIVLKAAGRSFSKLSSSQLEIVVILMKNGELTRSEIEKIRGKDSSFILRSLVEMRVIRKKRYGKRILYTFTRSFKESGLYEEINNIVGSDENDK